MNPQAKLSTNPQGIPRESFGNLLGIPPESPGNARVVLMLLLLLLEGLVVAVAMLVAVVVTMMATLVVARARQWWRHGYGIAVALLWHSNGAPSMSKA